MDRVDTVDAAEAVDGRGDTLDQVDEVDEVEVAASPCEPNPCVTPPTPTCAYDRTAVSGWVSPGVCSVVEGAAHCEYLEAREPCPEGPCVLGGCLEVADKCEWPYSPHISYVAELKFGSEVPCCHDYTGDGVPDNKFGEVLAAVEPFIGNIDDYVAGQIAERKLNMLLDIQGLDAPKASPLDDAEVDVLGYESGFDALPFVDPATGLASMMMRLSTFLPEGHLIPRIRAAGRIEQGRITTQDGRLAFILLGFDDAPTELVVNRMGFEGAMSPGPNGDGFNIDGVGGGLARLWGEVDRKTFLASLNAEFQYSCPCTVFSRDDGQVPIDIESDTCNTPESHPCEDNSGICQALSDAVLCPTFLALLGADIDTDGDGENDALSLGIRFRATSAKVAWIQGCPGPTR